MPDKRTKALKTANIRISTLVWKLHREIESAKEQDISFTKVDTVRKLATDTFKLFIKHGVLDEKAHLKIRSPPPANLDRRQNVSTTAFCDDVKKRLNYEDDETHDCIERNPRKPREFEEKYKETNLENIRLGQEFDCFERSPRKPRDFEEKYIKAKLENIHLQQEFDCFERSPRKPRDFEEKYKKAKLENIHLQQELSRVQKCIGELEYQSKCLIYQVDLAEKEKSDVSRKDDMRYKHLESEVNRYKAEINDLLHSDSSNNHRVHANRYRSERDLARCEIEELKIELEKRKDNSLQSDLEYLKKTLRRTEVELKGVKDENTVLRHANEYKTKMIEEIRNRDREDLKREENSNRKLVEENEELRNIVFEMERQLAGQNQEHIDTEHQYRSDIDRYRQERNRANSKLNTLQEQMKNKTAKLKEQEALYYEDRKQLENRIQDLEDQISDRLGKLSQQEQLDPVRDELSIMKIKLSSLEDELKINKDRKYVLENENEELNNRYQDVLRKLRESESRYSSQSDIEKENESLKHELTMSLMNIEKIKQDYKDLEKRHDTEMTRNKETTYRLQNDLDRLKSQQDLQKQTSRGELDSLKEQREKLERDKQILRTKIYSLENEKIGLEERIKKAELILENQQTLREENSNLKESLEMMKKEMENMEEKYKKETAIRICTDGTTTKLKEENDRLWKERNKAKYDIDRISREKEELAHELQHEIDAAKVEYDNLKKDKNELTSTFQQRAKKDQEKIDQLEKERETLVARNTSGEKATQHNMYELLQLKNDYAACKQQKTVLEEDLRDQRQELTEHKKRIKDLESKDQRCTKCDLYERTLAKLKKENQELQDKYKKETAIRISTDGTTRKLKDENDRLRKERNRANIDVERISREKEELEHELQHEIDAAKLEHDNLKKDKNELTSLFQQKAKSYQEKIDQLEKECETLVARNISGEKTTQHNTYELLQLKNDYAVCKQQKALLEEDLSDQRQDITELEKRIKDLESKDQRCTKCDQYERALAKLMKENQELQDRDLESKNQRCTKCDQYERALEKLMKENQELQDRYNIVTTKLHNTEKKIIDLEEENKEQKRQNREVTGIVKKLVQEKRELENQLRSQETSAATKDSGEVITLQRRINILQSDNADLTQKCKHKDGLQEKSDKDLRQLKTVISNLQSDLVEHKQTNDTLSNRLEIQREEKLELEEKMRRRSPQVVSDARNCQNCWKHRNEISDLKRDINHLRDRLSEAAGNKLRENNPNIADLSDMNRPTSLADKFNSLYTDEYTDAMEVIEGSMDEAGAVHVMLEWLKCCYNWCERLAREQRDLLTTESIGFMNKYQGQKIDYVVSGNCLIHVKEFQKKIAVDTLTAVRKICHVKSVTQENLIHDNYIVKYIQRCSELCWMMQITDPPLCLKFDVKKNEDLDKTLYNAFTKNGSKIEYLVWPILFLHKSGPLLAKGVAQGT